MSFTALVLAGTRPGGDPLARDMGVAHKSLIEIGGRTVLDRVLVALEEAGASRIVVSADDSAVREIAFARGAEPIDPARGPSGSVAAALAQTGAPLLVTTSDHALLEADWVEALISQTPDDADLSVMLARRELVERASPDTQRTYLRFADGAWSGCNLFYLRTDKARAALDLWQSVEKDRKRPWKIAARLGPATLLSLVLRRLSLAQGLHRLGSRVGLEAALVPAPDGRAAIDLDKPQDLALIEKLLTVEGS